MTTIEPLPCPFCGGNAGCGMTPNGSTYIECADREPPHPIAFAFAPTRAEAMACWNRRPAPHPETDAERELREANELQRAAESLYRAGAMRGMPQHEPTVEEMQAMRNTAPPYRTQAEREMQMVAAVADEAVPKPRFDWPLFLFRVWLAVVGVVVVYLIARAVAA